MINPARIKSSLIFLILIYPLLLLITAKNASSDEPSYKISSHHLTVTVSLSNRSIRAVDRITLNEGGTLRLLVRKGAVITRLRYGGKRVPISIKKLEDRPLKEILVTLPERPSKAKSMKTLSISFHEKFPSVYQARKEIKRGIAYMKDGAMGREGMILPSNSYWYPQEEDGLSQYSLLVNMPRGYITVSEGDWKLHKHSSDRGFDTWRTSKPVDGINLVSARFKVKKEFYNGIKIYTFFLKHDTKLSRLYLDKTKEYLKLYSELFGPYPFKKFAVVESFLPTGYGMPSFTLLGSKVLRLPFIPDTSLGHEIAHSWWGNSVYIDLSFGNWAEALTTYTADYLFERKKGAQEAARFRFEKIKGYKNFAGSEAVSLKDFSDSTEMASRAVGYDKGMMVFSMLEDKIGKEAFDAGLKEFYAENAFTFATWKEIGKAFEKASKKNLKPFFNQWVFRAGAPSLSLRDVSLIEKDGGYILKFKIGQKAPYFKLDVPVKITFKEAGDVVEKVKLKKESAEFSLTLKERPISIEVDPEFTLLRLLSEKEAPPSLSTFFGDKEAAFVLPTTKTARDKYSAPSKLLSKDFGIEVVDENDAAMEDYLKEKSLFIFGGPGENSLFDKLEEYLPETITLKKDGLSVGDKTYTAKGVSLAIAFKNPENPSKVICVFIGKGSKAGILGRARKMRYFTKYSLVVIEGTKTVEKKTFPGEKVLRHEFKGVKASEEPDPSGAGGPG
ncbi:MAG: M1 family metallopeptidase [Thermodesulfobacteriota bacterium]